MTDPVSAAGFAIGAVSLGIQVCQGLVSYYADWKSYDDDVDRIFGKLRGLKETLENLKNGMMKVQSANAKELEDVNKKILSCDDSIHRLQAVLKKCRSSPTPNRVQKFVQKTLYPFRKTTLHELDAIVRDLQGKLHTALLSLLIIISNDQCEDLSILISTSQTRREEFEEVRHGIQSTAAEVGGIHDGVKSIQQQTNIIQASTSNISSALATGFENLQSYQQTHLPKLNDRIETLTELFNTFSEDQSRRKEGSLLNSELTASRRTAAVQNPARSLQARLIEKPSLLRAACENSDFSKDVPQSSSMTECMICNPSSSRRFFRSKTCFCPSLAYSSELRPSHPSQPHGPIWGAKFNSSTVIHHKGCALLKDAEREKSWKLRVVYCGHIIAQALTMSIELRYGAGGYSISPSLSCDRVVSSHSPIFQLIENYSDIIMSIEAARLTQKIDSMIRDIEQLYQGGKASVHDVDEKGDNILHKITRWDYFGSSKEFLMEFIRLFKYLSDCGVRTDRVNAQGMTCLDKWQSEAYFTPLESRKMVIDNMMDLGAESVNIGKYFPPAFAESVRRYEELAEGSNFNDICRAILRQSETELRKVLQCSHHLIDEPNALGLRPLHLSATWPSGIEILMNNGANINVTDDWKLLPVDHAIYLACSKSLALFAEADCELRPSSRRVDGSLGMATWFAAIYDSDQALRISVAESVIKMEANQRRKLQALVSHYLPKSSIITRPLLEDRLIDVRAFDAVTTLKQHDVSIPTSLDVKEYCGTVYHLYGFETEVLNSLWKAGFRNINEPDPSGHTPLILPIISRFPRFGRLQSFLERTGWFIDKGVNPDQKIQHLHQNSYWNCKSNIGCSCLKSGHSAMHFLAFNLSVIRFWIDLTKDQSKCLERTRVEPVLHNIFNNATRDTCKCACSSDGCQAINIIVKMNLSFSDDLDDIFHSAIWPIPATKATHFILETTFSEIIRSLTFHVLDLTHTCCRQSKDWIDELQLTPFEDEEDISEIHDEEREDLQLLEDLLLEFEQQRRDQPSSFRKFMNGYWLTRMREVLSGQNLPEAVSKKESSEVSTQEESLDAVSEEESLDEVSEEELTDEDEHRNTEADFDDTSSHHSHRVNEVYDDPEDSD